LPQHIPVPIDCEQFVVVGLTRKEADTMTPRGYKSRKSTPRAQAYAHFPDRGDGGAELMA
jgi:hypothetical protein